MEYFSKFCLHQQVFAKKNFCMKTRLCNIFKTTNTMTLINVILENLYNLQTPCNTTPLK